MVTLSLNQGKVTMVTLNHDRNNHGYFKLGKSNHGNFKPGKSNHGNFKR